jgi:hypothetical protein
MGSTGFHQDLSDAAEMRHSGQQWRFISRYNMNTASNDNIAIIFPYKESEMVLHIFTLTQCTDRALQMLAVSST